MPTVTALIRAHLFEQTLGYAEPPRRLPDLPELQHTEWCAEFDRLRRNRMIMGSFRYGRLDDPGKFTGYDILAGLRRKLEYYEETGNTEALVDAANYLMLEFMRPSHTAAHFHGEDDHKHCPSLSRGA